MLNPYQTRGSMKAKISRLSIAITSAVLSYSGLVSADTTNIQVGTGYRQDSLTSSVAQRSSINPRSKSNLHYRDVEICFIAARAKSTFGCCESYVRADFDYGWVLDGKLRESLNLRERDSTSEFSHCGNLEEGRYLDVLLRNDLKTKSFVWDLDFAFIYPIENCWCENWMIGPGIGFSVNRQHFHAKHKVDFKDASISNSVLEEFGITSHRRNGNSNRTSWWGPWIGFDFAYNSHDCWNFYGEFEVHFGRVRHQRNTNIENCKGDHCKSTKSYWGPSIKIGSTYTLCECWYLDASFYYSKFFSFNSRNDIKWATANIRLDIGYTF